MADAEEPIVHGKALEWGGSLGIRISKSEAKRLGIRVGQDLHLKLLPAEHRLDVGQLRTFKDGRGADDHDTFLGEARSKQLGRKAK